MGRSLRTTLLAIVLPLTAVVLAMSALAVADLVTSRRDVAALRESALRSIHAARYAHHLQTLLSESYAHLAGLRDAREAISEARRGMEEDLERLESLAREARDSDAAAAGFTSETLASWRETQEQVDHYLARSAALSEKGERDRARRLIVDDLDVLVRGRIFATLDGVLQRERATLEEYRSRVRRASEWWLLDRALGVDLRDRIAPEVDEVVLAERVGRLARAELTAFARYALESRALDPAYGLATGHATEQLARLQRVRGERDGADAAGEAGTTQAALQALRDAYARGSEQLVGSPRPAGFDVVRDVERTLQGTLLARTGAAVSALEPAVERDLARLDWIALGILVLTIALAALALAASLASPLLASRMLIRPVSKLVGTVIRFREGSKDARSQLHRRDELGLLSRSLDALLTDLEESDQKVRALAFYDSTTGLPNRQFFQERLAGSLVTARVQGRSMGLLNVHLSELRQVNETFGHSTGDELLRQIATRLCDSVRISDVVSRKESGRWKLEVSRIGGDEFTVLLTNIRKAADAAVVAERVLARLTEPFDVNGREIALRVSLGIGIYPQDGADADTLLRNAAAAMAHALERGGNEYQFYSEAMNVANSRKLQIQARLRGAIDRGELSVHYQPLRNARTGRLVGAEALLRWTDSELGPLPPDEFVPIAEHSGLISRIGAWVLEQACRQARSWQDAGYTELRMSVNVSACQLGDEDWVETVEDTLRSTGLSPGLLDLEITETSIVQEDPMTLDSLKKLADLGVGIVLDDFGTGYSSLTHLRRLPINRIKIDRSFVSEISEQGEGAALVGAIIALARGLKLEVVAEGVETREQAAFLQQSQCDEIQGYLISRAVPAAEFEAFLRRSKPDPA